MSNAIAIPQQAVTRTQQGDTVSVVDAEGKISKRNVKISAAQNNQWVVLDGLKAGEQVMVDGFQKLQMMPPGTPVKAVPWTPVAAGGAPAAAPAPAAAAPTPAAAPAAAPSAAAPSAAAPATAASAPAPAAAPAASTAPATSAPASGAADAKQ